MSMYFLEQVITACAKNYSEKSDWHEVKDPVSEQVYYLNKANGVTSWVRPEIMGPVSADSATEKKSPTNEHISNDLNERIDSSSDPLSPTSAAVQHASRQRKAAHEAAAAAADAKKALDDLKMRERSERVGREEKARPKNHRTVQKSTAPKEYIISDRLKSLSEPHHAKHQRSPSTSAIDSGSNRTKSRRKVDMQRIESLAVPIVYKDKSDLKLKKVAPVGSRKKHTKASINRQIKRQEIALKEA